MAMQHFNSRLTKPLSSRHPTRQAFDYFLVLDFEATCESPRQITPQEIIEFPVLKVNAVTFDVESKFHHFVKPVHHPQLTSFCMKLTTITQDEVDAGRPFTEVLTCFDEWMRTEVGADKKVLFITCGDWDLKTMLPNQCQISGVDVPPYCKEWLNIKKAYHSITGTFCKGMMPMIRHFNLPHYGILHRGLDDCINIANILRELANSGCIFKSSGRIP